MKMGWKEMSVGEILQLEYGKPLEQSDRKPDGRFPAYGANGEKDRTDKFYHDKASIIVGRKGSAGEINLTEQKFWPLDVTYFVTFDEQQYDLKFLYHLLATLELTKLAKGVKPGINRNEVYSQTTRVPPLAEQQRIVAILDEAFEGLATAKANAEKNLQNARALFESHLQSVFTQREKGWVDRTLGELCKFENGDRGKNYPNREEYVATGIPWINTGHIQPDGTLSQDEMNFISRAKFNSLRSGKIRPNDLVYCLRGATLGKTAIVDPYTEGAIASSLVIIRPSKSVDFRFLYFFLISPEGQRQIKLYDNGAAQPNLGAKSVAKYVIPIPAVPEQKRIADSLDELRAETQRLAHIYERKLAALDALKQSLLHQAFSGQL